MNASQANKEFNTLYNRMNGIYRNIVRKYNMSDCQFWIFYALYIEERPLTQGELTEYLLAPKQTIHSAIQKMVDCNYILLRETSGKKKYFELTTLGHDIAEKTVKNVVQSEVNVLEKLTLEEREQMIHTITRYCDLLEKEAI